MQPVYRERPDGAVRAFTVMVNERAVRALLLAGVLAMSVSAAANAAAPAVFATAAPETGAANAAGDIPDSQVFVPYTSRDGYSVLVPEGWSRTVRGARATFTSHFDGEQIDVFRGGDVRAKVRALFGARDLHARNRAGGGVILRYTSQSKPDDVTGKTIALDTVSYIIPHGDRQAVLTLWAPRGADNTDQWQKIASSFRWR